MKKTLLWGAIASLFFASCSKSEMVESIESSCDFVAQLADVSRTELDGTAVIWNAEDELTIFTKTEHNRHYKVKTLTEDGRTATFGFVDYTGTSNGTISANYAVYPYDAQATISDDVISTVIASEQQYNAEKVDLSYALMAAKSENNSFAFVNAGALMRFNVSKSELIPDSYTLNSIKLSSAANNIAGDVTIDLSAESRAVVASTGTKQITLTAINQEITTEAKAFYVALPAVSFADKDLTVTFTFADGEKSFALPAFDLLQGSIKTIAYQINDADDFTGTTPDSGEDFEGETPGTEAKPANNEIWYTATEKVVNDNWTVDNTFGANITDHTFDTTTGKGIITFDGEVTEIGSSAFYGYSGLTSITIPDSVTTIGSYTFTNCDGLTSITIPNGVTEILHYTFKNCDGLTSITIPDSVTSIGENPFEDCKNLAEFKGKFASEDGRCLIVNGVLKSFAPAGLTEYTIPDSVTEIGYRAFEYCSGLTSVTIPNSVTEIGYYAFEYCDGLTSITIPDSVTEIGNYAFSSCDGLTSITIPNSVTSIGFRAFVDCYNLTSVFCERTTPPTANSYSDWYAFNGNAANRKIYVPAESVYAYMSADGWKDYAYSIEPYDF